MWEVCGSLQALQGGYGRRTFGTWCHRVRRDLHRTHLAGPVGGRLFPVAPHAAYYPDLLTPVEGTLGLEEALEAILSTPRSRLRQEIDLLGGNGPGHGAWLDDLRSARTGALVELADTMRAYHQLAVRPYWPAIRARVESDIGRRRQALREGGVNGLLGSFHPMMRWHFPVLEIPGHPSDRDIHLGGRGLLLIPSYFAYLHPATIFNPDLPQAVVYPAGRVPEASQARPGAALGRLLGETRAAVLQAVAVGGTTSDLARRLGVSLSTISHHIAILRDAGLIISQRNAAVVLHTLSPVGAALLTNGKRHIDRGRTTDTR